MSRIIEQTSFDGAASLSIDSLSSSGFTDSTVIYSIGIQINVADTNNLPDAIAALETGATFDINPESSGGDDNDDEKLQPSFDYSELTLKAGGEAVTNKFTFRLPENASVPALSVTYKNDDNAVDFLESDSDNENLSFVIKPLKAGTAKIIISIAWVEYDEGNVGTENKDTYTCTITVTDDQTDDTDNTDDSTESSLWSGSLDLGTGWDKSLPISAFTINAGDKLRISYKTGSEDYHQIKIMDGEWTPLESPEVIDTTYYCVNAPTGSTSYEFTLSAADAAAVTEKGLVISGYDVTLTSVTHITAGSSSEEPTTPSIPEKVNAATDNSTGVDVSCAKADIISSVLTDEDLEAARNGIDVDIVLNIKDTSIPESDKAAVEEIITTNQKIELLLDISITKIIGNNAQNVSKTPKVLAITIEIPNFDASRKYSVVRVHDGKAEIITSTTFGKKITFYSDSFSTYGLISEPAKSSSATVSEYNIVIGSSHVTASRTSAPAGTAVKIYTDFGYNAKIYAGNKVIAIVSSGETFTMPASDVYITAVSNGDTALLLGTKATSYIYVYNSDMKEITVKSSRRSKVDGEITIKLGTKYAGRTVTLYSGRKSTSEKLCTAVVDENGYVTFTVELGRNYTAVIE